MAVKKAAKKKTATKRTAAKKTVAKKTVGKKIAAKKTSRYTTSDGLSYLTKRVTVTKARSAGRKAAVNAMQTMGFVVVAEGDNVIKKFADGHTEIIGPIANRN